MVVKAILTYENGDEATFTGNPVDLASLPTTASSQTPEGSTSAEPEAEPAA